MKKYTLGTYNMATTPSKTTIYKPPQQASQDPDLKHLPLHTAKSSHQYIYYSQQHRNIERAPSAETFNQRNDGFRTTNPNPRLIHNLQERYQENSHPGTNEQFINENPMSPTLEYITYY